MLYGITPEQLALENSKRTEEQERLRREFVRDFRQDLLRMDDDTIRRFPDGLNLRAVKAAFLNGDDPLWW